MVKNLPASIGNAREAGLIPGWGSSPGGRNGNSLQILAWENSIGRVSWQAAVHGVSRVGHD